MLKSNLVAALPSMGFKELCELEVEEELPRLKKREQRGLEKGASVLEVVERSLDPQGVRLGWDHPKHQRGSLDLLLCCAPI